MSKKGKSQNITLVDKPKTISVDYQLLVAERDDLLEAELGYKRRIEQLEKEAVDTLKSFDVLYNENKILRSKLETPDGVQTDSIESYNSIYKDREHLREANRAYKRRIRQLENDAENEQGKYQELYSKHQLVTQKAQLETEFATRARDEKIDDLEKEHDEITKKLKLFLKEREQYEYKIAEMDKERNELQNKYDFLANEKHEFQLRCDLLQADREKLKDKIAELEDKIPDPEVKAKEEQQFLTTQAHVVALQVANTDASKQIHKLQEEIRVLNKLKKEKVEMVDRALSVIIDEDAIQKAHQTKTQLDDTLLELEEIRKRSIYTLRDNDELKLTNARLEIQLESYIREIEECKKELEIKKTAIDDLSLHVRGGESLNEEYLALQERFKDLNATKTVLEKELIQEKKMAKLKHMELSNEIDKTKTMLNESEKEKMKLESELQNIQMDHSSQGKVIEAQAMELRNMKSQLEQIQSMLDDKTEKYEEMKKTEKEIQQEIRESRITLHVTRHELDTLKMEKAGHFETLKHEMENAKTQRQEESEQMRKETLRLKDEVKQLKDYEYKITTMDAEIRRLMNRLRMTDKLRKLPKKRVKKETDGETDEMSELKRKQRTLEREKMQLLQEKKQWEILKDKYSELQDKNRRILEENKRVRGDLDGSNFKVDALEKKFKKIQVKTDDIKDPKGLQRATYVEKEPIENTNVREIRLVAKKRHENQQRSTVATKPILHAIKEEHVDRPTIGAAMNRGLKALPPKIHKTYDRKTTRTNLDIKQGMRFRKPKLLSVQTSELKFGKGYSELHKTKYKPNSKLALL
ncbi:hypothetical protein DPMN_024271 [Dreissena polymorpha]|uniref:Uncharacterized protein n=1 Tax=Dreissena polymorpha TaxID=45954 RepID=A0A9D4RAR6_DREPO|nr:hypothetical protein DPMN_024271 [Dreissena polymorpha]